MPRHPVRNPGHPRARGIWSEVGYLVETPAAYPELTVRKNLDVVRRMRCISSRNAVDEAIGRLVLDECADHRARTLSLGNAQRLGLAKALLHRPRLLILDEPANGLDPAGVVEIRELLKALAADGPTVLLSSHVLAEVAGSRPASASSTGNPTVGVVGFALAGVVGAADIAATLWWWRDANQSR